MEAEHTFGLLGRHSARMNLHVGKQRLVQLMRNRFPPMVVHNAVRAAIGKPYRNPVADVGRVREKVQIVDVREPVRSIREQESSVSHFSPIKGGRYAPEALAAGHSDMRAKYGPLRSIYNFSDTVAPLTWNMRRSLTALSISFGSTPPISPNLLTLRSSRSRPRKR